MCCDASSFFISLLFPRHDPASEHSEEVKAFRAALLNAHSSSKHDPTGRLVAGDAQGLIGTDAREPRDILDISLGVILIRRRPATDNSPDGEQPVRMIIRPRQQHERCPPAIRHCFKLTELTVCLHGFQALPLIL